MSPTRNQNRVYSWQPVQQTDRTVPLWFRSDAQIENLRRKLMETQAGGTVQSNDLPSSKNDLVIWMPKAMLKVTFCWIDDFGSFHSFTFYSFCSYFAPFAQISRWQMMASPSCWRRGKSYGRKATYFMFGICDDILWIFFLKIWGDSATSHWCVILLFFCPQASRDSQRWGTDPGVEKNGVFFMDV